MGVNQTAISRLATVFEVVAAVIRPYALWNCFVVVVFTLKAVPISTQYFLTSVLIQLT